MLTFISNAQEVREIIINEDRDQDYMTTKVYELKHVKSADIMPFVKGAVKRNDPQSNVNRLSYADKGKEFLIVSMDNDLIPDIDDMVKKLDRPGKKDADGSLVKGTGIYRYVYCPKHRATSDMLAALQGTVVSGDGASYFDASTSMFYWKDSKSDGDFTLEWIKALDRPVPQMRLTLKVYEINDSDLKELGIDWISFKNGPGINLFGAGLESLSIFGQEEILDTAMKAFDVAQGMDFMWGGFFFAPQFDASFIRMLNQKGKAKVQSSGSLTVVNTFNGSYSIAFSPDFQNIVKDEEAQMSVVSGTSPAFRFTINNPVICFNGKEGTSAANILFDYNLSMNSTVERNNMGAEIVNYTTLNSDLTLGTDAEKLLTYFEKDTDVEQGNGFPILGDIPGLKYLFGVSTSSDSKSKMYVTIKAEAVNPDSDLSEFAGQVKTAAEILKAKKEVIK